MDYIIEYQSREQYDECGNCKPKSHAKSFSEKSTLGEIVEWVKDTSGGVWCGEYNTLTNPQIIGINNGKETTEYGYGETPEPLIHYQEDEDGGWYPCTF